MQKRGVVIHSGLYDSEILLPSLWRVSLRYLYEKQLVLFPVRFSTKNKKNENEMPLIHLMSTMLRILIISVNIRLKQIYDTKAHVIQT